MGTWGTAITDSDAFADIYSEFFDQYNNGENPEKTTQIKKGCVFKWRLSSL